MAIEKTTPFSMFVFGCSADVTARFHLLNIDGRSYYCETTIIAATGATGQDIIDGSGITAPIIGARLIHATGSLYFNTSGDGSPLASSGGDVPTMTTGITVAPPASGSWINFGQVA